MIKRIATFFILSLVFFTTTASAESKTVPAAVAVLYFDYDGTNEELKLLRKGLAQMLISDLSGASETTTLIERERLEDILKELDLAGSNKVDPKTAAKIGKLIGARYIILGGFFNMMGQLRVDSRLINVETGVIMGSVGKNGKLEDFFTIEQALSKELGVLLGQVKPIEIDDSQPKLPKKTKTKRKSATKKPKKMTKAVVLQYSKALDAKDKGNKEEAIKHLKNVVKEEPDFELAAIDLDSLMQ